MKQFQFSTLLVFARVCATELVFPKLHIAIYIIRVNRTVQSYEDSPRAS